jgi:hypothetical protein
MPRWGSSDEHARYFTDSVAQHAGSPAITCPRRAGIYVNPPTWRAGKIIVERIKDYTKLIDGWPYPSQQVSIMAH